MTNRITEKMINARIDWIASELKTPKEYMNEKRKINIGYLSLYRCLGVYALHQVTNEGGGVRVLLSGSTARELFDMLGAFYDGMMFKKRYEESEAA